jgi:hypothetical protein
MGTKGIVLMLALVLGGAAAKGADLARERTATPQRPPAFPQTEYELKWDNGKLGYVKTHIEPGNWVGNDFDISTLGANNIKYIRVYSSDLWPNGRWDGFRIGVFKFNAGAPGALIWGPRFVKGTGTGYRWCDFDVNYTLPKGATEFVAAVEQVYKYPDTDPYCLDTGPPKLRGWTYYRGIWTPLQGEGNLMLRAVMQGDIGVAPTSIGRVKALYY